MTATGPLHLPEPAPIEEQPTQIQRPWRATFRTVSAAIWGLIPIWPAIVLETNLSTTIPWVAASLAVTGTITRVAAMPKAEAWLAEWMPSFSADPTVGAKHRKG